MSSAIDCVMSSFSSSVVLFDFYSISIIVNPHQIKQGYTSAPVHYHVYRFHYQFKLTQRDFEWLLTRHRNNCCCYVVSFACKLSQHNLLHNGSRLNQFDIKTAPSLSKKAHVYTDTCTSPHMNSFDSYHPTVKLNVNFYLSWNSVPMKDFRIVFSRTGEFCFVWTKRIQIS